MADQSKPEDAEGTPPGHAEAAEKPRVRARLKKPTREQRLAKALRDNLKRRKAGEKKV